MKSNERTNVMRILDQKKIAAILNEDKDRVFKTLVT